MTRRGGAPYAPADSVVLGLIPPAVAPRLSLAWSLTLALLAEADELPRPALVRAVAVGANLSRSAAEAVVRAGQRHGYLTARTALVPTPRGPRRHTTLVKLNSEVTHAQPS